MEEAMIYSYPDEVARKWKAQLDIARTALADITEDCDDPAADLAARALIRICELEPVDKN